VSKSPLTHSGLNSTCTRGWCKSLAATEGRILSIGQGSPGEYGCRETFSSKLRRECLTGDLLQDEGIVRTGATRTRPLQQCENKLAAGLQPCSAGLMADRSIAGHGSARRKGLSQPLHDPDYVDEPYPLRAALR